MTKELSLKQIPLQQAIQLLQPGKELSVMVIRQSGGLVCERWPRARVQSLMQAHGPLLAGPAARQVHHGLAVVDNDKNIYMLETGHT